MVCHQSYYVYVHKKLSPVYATIFNRCVNEHIPSIWKTATVIPVHKKSSPKELNDYRPISLTSVPFKTLERIVQEHLCREPASVLDKHQFSYQKKTISGRCHFDLHQSDLRAYSAWFFCSPPGSISNRPRQ